MCFLTHTHEVRTDMPSTGVPITCRRCNFRWNDGDFGPGIFGFQDASNITFSNITTNCPRCGGVASPDDGTFDVRAGHWRLIRGIADDLRSAQATADDYARLLRLLRRASQPTKSLTRSQRRRPSGDWLRLSAPIHRGGLPTFLPPSWLWCSGWCHRLATPSPRRPSRDMPTGRESVCKLCHLTSWMSLPRTLRNVFTIRM